MALVRKIEKASLQSPKVHGYVDCTYTTFCTEDGRKYLQIDTYGSQQRKMKGKKSQTIQLDEKSAKGLFEILKNEFLIP